MINEQTKEIIYRKAVNRFGKLDQLIVATEELSELQKELCKTLRGKMNIDNIAEEIADVEIMLSQLHIIFNIDYDIEKQKQTKLERLSKMIEEIFFLWYNFTRWRC